jgi:hypothetical protein
MGSNVYARYNPANSLTNDEDENIENENGDEIDAAAREGRRQQTGLANAGNANVVQNVLEQQNHWREVNDRQEHARLHRALLALKDEESAHQLWHKSLHQLLHKSFVSYSSL